MAERSAIEWTDATFNPWIGCTKVSPGCDNCYAARQDGFRKWTPAGWGAGQPRKRTKTWGDPKKWNDQPFAECGACGWRGEGREAKVRDYPGESTHLCPACEAATLNKARRRVFCASLADVFDNEVPDGWRADLFALIDETTNLDWLLLTKRIGNAKQMMEAAMASPGNIKVPLPNVWLGATVVNQEEADRDIPKLLATPARVRFLSMEPLLGEVDLSQWLLPFRPCKDCPCPDPDVSREGIDRCCCDPELMPSELGWVIVGGESGRGARPMHPEWARGLRDQCAAAGVPMLFKQWGEWAPGTNFADAIPSGTYCDFDGTLATDEARLWKVGKKAAGRLLDGVEHNGFPEVRPCTK